MAKPRFYGKTTACTSNRAQDLRWMKKNTRNRERAPRTKVTKVAGQIVRIPDQNEKE